MIRLLLVDDDASVRKALTRWLGLHADIQVVGEAVDGKRAVDMVREARPDVVIMDIHVPVLDGIHGTKLIRAEHPTIRVIGLSAHTDKAQQILMPGRWPSWISNSGEKRCCRLFAGLDSVVQRRHRLRHC